MFSADQLLAIMERHYLAGNKIIIASMQQWSVGNIAHRLTTGPDGVVFGHPPLRVLAEVTYQEYLANRPEEFGEPNPEDRKLYYFHVEPCD